MAPSRRDKKKKTIIVFIVCCTLALIFLRWTWRKDELDEVDPLTKKCKSRAKLRVPCKGPVLSMM